MTTSFGFAEQIKFSQQWSGTVHKLLLIGQYTKFRISPVACRLIDWWNSRPERNMIYNMPADRTTEAKWSLESWILYSVGWIYLLWETNAVYGRYFVASNPIHSAWNTYMTIHFTRVLCSCNNLTSLAAQIAVPGPAPKSIKLSGWKSGTRFLSSPSTRLATAWQPGMRAAAYPNVSCDAYLIFLVLGVTSSSSSADQQQGLKEGSKIYMAKV